MSQSSPSAPVSPTLPRQTRVTLPVRTFGQTSRTGLWWVVPVVVFCVFGGFIAYSTWAALQNNHYRYTGGGADYLSPFYSPEIFSDHDPAHAWFGDKPSWFPTWLPFSPALLILWAPGGFRFTCYYYRGAYYKAFWADPPSCSVGEPRKGYRGENSFPLIIQNIHRYFMYLAVVFLFLLSWDVIRAMWFIDAQGKGHIGLGLGTLVLALNVCLLTSYTMGCHSLRHLIGGLMDEISKSPRRFKAYKCVTCFNKRHMMWAWLSLFGVAFADIYVRLCSMGIWHDWRIF